MLVIRSKMDLRFTLPALLVLVLASCNSTEQPAADVAVAGIERSVKEVSITSGEPVTYADLSIDGMSCEMMCGGSIKKALAKLPGVNSTEIKFVEGDDRDHAIVTYDESKVTDAEMIEAIQKLHDGQYKVLAVEITKQVQGTSEHSSVNAKDQKRVNVSTPTIAVLPSILALLTQIMRL